MPVFRVITLIHLRDYKRLQNAIIHSKHPFFVIQEMLKHIELIVLPLIWFVVLAVLAMLGKHHANYNKELVNIRILLEEKMLIILLRPIFLLMLLWYWKSECATQCGWYRNAFKEIILNNLSYIWVILNCYSSDFITYCYERWSIVQCDAIKWPFLMFPFLSLFICLWNM